MRLRDTNETPRKQTLFAVPLSCDGCIKAVSDSLYKLGGISNVEGNLKDQLISVKGTGKSNWAIEVVHVLIVTSQLPPRPSWKLSRQRAETLSCVDQDPQTAVRAFSHQHLLWQF